MPGYELKQNGHALKLKEPGQASASAGCQQGRPILDGGGPPQGNLQCRNINMAAFARQLQRLISIQFYNYPLLDSTGLEGGWDIDFIYGMRPLRAHRPEEALTTIP